MATTGATTGYPQPKVVVPSYFASQYEQRYVLTAVGSGAGIRCGEMKFEFEEGSSPEFLVGISEFYSYSPDGSIETSLFTFYPFTELPGNEGGLKAPALKVGASASYGQVVPDGELQMFKVEGDRVKGQIRLHGGGPWPVEFRILGDSESTGGHPPAAKQLPEAEPNNPGWGAESSEYEGDWELTNAAANPTEKAGTLGAVIGVAQGLGIKGAVVSGGSMTVEGKPATAEVTIETGGQKSPLHPHQTGLGRRQTHRAGPRRRPRQPAGRPLRRHRRPGRTERPADLRPLGLRGRIQAQGLSRVTRSPRR